MNRSSKKQRKAPPLPKVFALRPIIFFSLAATPSAAPTIKIECERAVDVCSKYPEYFNSFDQDTTFDELIDAIGEFIDTSGVTYVANHYLNEDVHPGGALYGTKEREGMTGNNKTIRSKGLGAINDNNAWLKFIQEKSILYEVRTNRNTSFRPKRFIRKFYLCICLSKNVKQKASSSSVGGVKKSKKKQKLPSKLSVQLLAPLQQDGSSLAPISKQTRTFCFDILDYQKDVVSQSELDPTKLTASKFRSKLMQFGIENHPDYLAEKKTLSRESILYVQPGWNVNHFEPIRNRSDLHDYLSKEMEKPTRWRNDETLLLKCSLGASKARGNIILSVDDNFFNCPKDLPYCSDDDYEDHETSFNDYSQPETTLFSPKKKVTSKERRVQTWTDPMKIVNLILRLYRERDESTNSTGPLHHALLKEHMDWMARKLTSVLTANEKFTANEEEASAFAEVVQSDTALLSLKQIKTLWLDEIALNNAVRNNFYNMFPEKDNFPPVSSLNDTPPEYAVWALLRKNQDESGNMSIQENLAFVSPTPGASQRTTHIRQEAQQIGNTNKTKCDLIIFSLKGVDSTLIINDELEVLTFGDIFQNDHHDLKEFREELEWDEEVEYSYIVKGVTRDFAFPKESRFFCMKNDAIDRIKTVVEPLQVDIIIKKADGEAF